VFSRCSSSTPWWCLSHRVEIQPPPLNLFRSWFSPNIKTTAWQHPSFDSPGCQTSHSSLGRGYHFLSPYKKSLLTIMDLCHFFKILKGFLNTTTIFCFDNRFYFYIITSEGEKKAEGRINESLLSFMMTEIFFSTE